MRVITIPPDALEAGARAMKEAVGAESLDASEERAYRLMARAAFLAMIEAWPGMSQLAENDSASIREMAALILPLPAEASDDQ